MFFLETDLYMWTILTSKCVSSCLFLNFKAVQHPTMVFTGCINIMDVIVFNILSVDFDCL